MSNPIVEYIPKEVVWDTDVPNPVDNEFQIFIKDNVAVMVDFICPCGCGHRCPTHLILPNKKTIGNFPRWVLSSGPTLDPSIRWLSGCKAHFNITNGKVIIHGDSGK